MQPGSCYAWRYRNNDTRKSVLPHQVPYRGMSAGLQSLITTSVPLSDDIVFVQLISARPAIVGAAVRVSLRLRSHRQGAVVMRWDCRVSMSYHRILC